MKRQGVKDRLLAVTTLALVLILSLSIPSTLAINSTSTSISSTHLSSLPAKRTYDSHYYYSVQLKRDSDDNGVDPREVADVLGVELVERVGELKDHWLVRSQKPILGNQVEQKRSIDESSEEEKEEILYGEIPQSQDPILKRWQHLSLRSPNFPSRSSSSIISSIHSVERQVLTKRHKRNVIYSPWDTPSHYPSVRNPLPGPEPQPYPFPEEIRRPPPIPDAISTKMMGQFDIRDPIFNEQWHLANDRISGNDLNTTGAWEQNINGKGINVCLIDDGLDMHSPDLKDNFFEAGSYDFNQHTALPEPRLSDDQHGTRCAGEIAAVRNDVCGVGVAYEAHVAGVRILSGPISDADEAAALNYKYQENHIYSCSWGPPDDGRSMDAPKGLIAKALLNGVQNGRGGKGSIFVFAGGNGGASDDQCNFDGYTNSIYSMTIAAVDREGTHPYYSEMCSANLASGWSSGSGDHIHTTDVAWNGVNKCTTMHGGTSAAAPLVAGVTALALQVRPDLTWRDMQHIAVHSAQMINPQDKDWQKTQAGRHYNHKYGYGIIDASKFVEEAKNHKLVNPQAWFNSGNLTIPGDETFIHEEGLSNTFIVTQKMLDDANLESLEHVTARVWITHDRRGDVDVELTSPHGTKSVLARPRRYDDATTGFPGWSFMSLKHWDESPIGEWKIEVFDRVHPKMTGNFYAWSLTLWGASIDPSKATSWNFPENSVEFHETLPAAPDSTSVYIPAGATTYQHSKPTDHLPDNHGIASGESHEDFTNGNQNGKVNSPPSDATKPEADTGYLEGLKSNSTWLIVAGGIVLIFAGSMAAFFIMRRRRRNGRNGGGGDYEFVPEDEEDNLAMSSLQGGANTGRGGKGKGNSKSGGKNARRAKELYDAFDEGSDQDDEDREDAALKRSGVQVPYHDEDEDGDGRFAIEDESEKTPVTATSFSTSTTKGKGRYTDGDGDDQPERLEGKETLGKEEEEKDLLFDVGKEDTSSGSGSGSWQDAAAEVGK